MPTILITEADRGIAPEFVRQYAREGWQVIATSSNPDRADELQALADIYVSIEIHQLDITDRAAIGALAWKLEDRTIDVLLNNAGVVATDENSLTAYMPQKMCGLDFPEWERLFKLNTLAPMAMVEAFTDLVAASTEKKIIALSTRLASIAANDDGAYYAYRSTNAALNAAVRSMAVDLAPSGISCAVLHSENPKSPAFPATRTVQEYSEESVAGLIAQIAALEPTTAGRFIGPDGQDVPW